MNVTVLGTKYRIVRKKYDEDESFSRRKISGYCDSYQKLIVLCDISTYPGWDHEPMETAQLCEKQTLRHEIVHAFFAESDLDESTFAYDGGWARNEEMVDWIASRGALIYDAWREAKAL